MIPLPLFCSYAAALVDGMITHRPDMSITYDDGSGTAAGDVLAVILTPAFVVELEDLISDCDLEVPPCDVLFHLGRAVAESIDCVGCCWTMPKVDQVAAVASKVLAEYTTATTDRIARFSNNIQLDHANG